MQRQDLGSIIAFGGKKYGKNSKKQHRRRFKPSSTDRPGNRLAYAEGSAQD